MDRVLRGAEAQGDLGPRGIRICLVTPLLSWLVQCALPRDAMVSFVVSDLASNVWSHRHVGRFACHVLTLIVFGSTRSGHEEEGDEGKGKMPLELSKSGHLGGLHFGASRDWGSAQHAK